MDNLTHGCVFGIDDSRDWLDVHCLPDGHRCKWQMLRYVMLPWRILPGTGEPSSALRLDRPAALELGLRVRMGSLRKGAVRHIRPALASR